MREWLIVLSVLLIAGILLDGWRRMRTPKIKMVRQEVSANDTLQLDEDPPLTSEFPSGGARIAAVRDDNDAENILQNVRQKHVESKKTRGVRKEGAEPDVIEKVAPEPASDPLPNLMKAFAKRTQAPQVPSADESFIAPDLKKLDAELDDLFPEIKPISVKAEAKIEAKPAPAKAAPQAAPVPQEVLVMHIMAPKGSTFYGDDLLPILMDLHMRFGTMDIFHRHAQENGTGPVLFSLANLVKPGTFELSSMSDFETPGLSLFMTLPCGEEAMHAFALMAQAAKRITQGLGGELKDEARNNMTQQIFEHYKERVAEFERKWRLQKAH
ncbi:MAG: cell division protein ZipA [Marinagarivorans sp.]